MVTECICVQICIGSYQIRGNWVGKERRRWLRGVFSKQSYVYSTKEAVAPASTVTMPTATPTSALLLTVLLLISFGLNPNLLAFSFHTLIEYVLGYLYDIHCFHCHSPSLINILWYLPRAWECWCFGYFASQWKFKKLCSGSYEPYFLPDWIMLIGLSVCFFWCCFSGFLVYHHYPSWNCRIIRGIRYMFSGISAVCREHGIFFIWLLYETQQRAIEMHHPTLFCNLSIFFKNVVFSSYISSINDTWRVHLAFLAGN